MKHILVTGGAGYIGSFMTKRLLDDGVQVTVLDSLERGYKERVDTRAKTAFGNLLDEQFIQNVLSDGGFDAVLHFAAFLSVGESMQNPGLYFKNNVQSAVNLLDAMHKNQVKKFIFSSTATVYGTPIQLPIPEDHPKRIENPYGESKLMVETILSWYQRVYGVSYVTLRYFNAAGAAFDGSLGEEHNPETHLIPNAIKAAQENKPFFLFGSDYNTPDGTCIRDYIHVLDLVDAHILALQKLDQASGGFTYNVGTGKGHTNKEVVEMIKKVSGKDIAVKIDKRRDGDAEATVADVTKIKEELGFAPKYSDLETIIQTAWKWHTRKTD